MTKKHSILNKTAGHCAYCGCQLNVNNLTRDHVVAKSRGGTSGLDNLLPACRACNLLKGDDSLDSFRLRFFWDTLHPADLVTYDSMVKAISKKRFYVGLENVNIRDKIFQEYPVKNNLLFLQKIPH